MFELKTKSTKIVVYMNRSCNDILHVTKNLSKVTACVFEVCFHIRTTTITHPMCKFITSFEDTIQIGCILFYLLIFIKISKVNKSGNLKKIK